MNTLRRNLIYITVCCFLAITFLPQTVLGNSIGTAEEEKPVVTEPISPPNPIEETPEPENPIKEEPEPEPTKPPDKPGTGGEVTPVQTEQPIPQPEPTPAPKPNQESPVEPESPKPKPNQKNDTVQPTPPISNKPASPWGNTTKPINNGSTNTPSTKNSRTNTTNENTEDDEVVIDQEETDENTDTTDEVKSEETDVVEEHLGESDEEVILKPTQTEIASVTDNQGASTSFMIGMIIFSIFVLVVLCGAGYWLVSTRKRKF